MQMTIFQENPIFYVPKNSKIIVQKHPSKVNKLSLKFEYNKVWKNKIKTIKGSLYYEIDKKWSIPYNKISLRRLLNLFPHELSFDFD